MSTAKFTIAGAVLATLAALGVIGMPLDAAAQTPASASSGEHVISSLGGSTRFSPPVTSVDQLRRMSASNRADLTQVLDSAGLSNISSQVLETMTSGAVTDTTVAPGEHLEWMALRHAGKPDVVRNVRWGGKAPFKAFRFTVDTPTMGYVFVVPYDCGNLSLVSATAVAPRPAPAPAPPPPPPAPAPAPRPPPPSPPSPPPPPPAPPEPVAPPQPTIAAPAARAWSVSVLLGLDNQFSGKMIQEATGRTAGGAPINLEETSYDEVYGKMGIFKIGVGYRTTPRTEAVVNFVYSSSDSEDTATQVGTVGTNPAVPLQVNFTGYKYWGVEGGQRWFFARTRFTPYVGYLVGINRHQDIRGTFVGVPSAVTPGLAAQDGKFFEKSWAFSLGPTGGVLIGVGPFEVMAETQLRYLGGLSDVDWLVEEGLRDVNSESSRWSLPILVGARIRF